MRLVTHLSRAVITQWRPPPPTHTHTHLSPVPAIPLTRGTAPLRSTTPRHNHLNVPQSASFAIFNYTFSPSRLYNFLIWPRRGGLSNVPGESGRAAAAAATAPETDRWIRRDGERRLLDRPYALALLPAGGPAVLRSIQPGFLFSTSPLPLPASLPLSLSIIILSTYDFPGSHVSFLALLRKREREKKKCHFPLFLCRASGSMFLADWLFQLTKVVLLRCLFLFFPPGTAIVFISRGFEIRAPCGASKFCGSAVLSRWMWSAGVTLSCRPLWYILGAKVPRVPSRQRGGKTR